MRTPRLPVVDWTEAPADLNGLVRFAERQNLVSARVPSHFKRSPTQYLLFSMAMMLSQTRRSANFIHTLLIIWYWKEKQVSKTCNYILCYIQVIRSIISNSTLSQLASLNFVVYVAVPFTCVWAWYPTRVALFVYQLGFHPSSRCFIIARYV